MEVKINSLPIINNICQDDWGPFNLKRGQTTINFFFFFRILPRFCVTVVFTGFLSTLNIYNLPTELLGVAKQLKIMTFLQQKT